MSIASVLRCVPVFLIVAGAVAIPESHAFGGASQSEGETSLVFQFPSSMGARAEAMGGAFTAVADDETAFFWNPAGIATGPFLRVGWHRGLSEALDRSVDRAASGTKDGNLHRFSSTGFSMAWTFMGVHYQRSRGFEVPAGRASGKAVGVSMSNLGVSIVQSLPLDNLVVAVNLGYLRSRGFATEGHEPMDSLSGSAAIESRLFDSANAVAPREGHFDLDVGVMYETGKWRVGFMGRHLTRPRLMWTSSRSAILARNLRAGVRIQTTERVSLSADFDLNSKASLGRELSMGGELAVLQGRLFARGGLRAYLGDARALPGVSLGGGVVIRGVRVDIAWLTGRRLGAQSRRGWWVNASLAR